MADKSWRNPFAEPMVKVTVKLPVDLTHWIDAQARTRKVTRTKAIYDSLTAQRTVMEELAKSVTLDGSDGDGARLLHSLLAQQTETIALSIDRRVREIASLRRQLTTALAMIDRLVGLGSPQQYERWKTETQAVLDRSTP
jgi:hypothetical protein